MSGMRFGVSNTTRPPAGKKRMRTALNTAGEESEDSDSGGSVNQQAAARPKKRFIWPEVSLAKVNEVPAAHVVHRSLAQELHRDFIAAVFDMGLKKADPARLKELMPKKDRSADLEAMKATLQKLRSFRYQMRSSLGGDNLDTPEELAQKGIVPSGGLGLSLGHNRNGSRTLASLEAEEALDMEGLTEAFEVPRELASAMEHIDSDQMRRSVELMGQCIQVQRSAHGVLLHAIEMQGALKTAIIEKLRQMGLPSVNNSAADIRAWAEVAGKRNGTGTMMDMMDGKHLGVSATAADTDISTRKGTGAGTGAGGGRGGGRGGSTGSGNAGMGLAGTGLRPSVSVLVQGGKGAPSAGTAFGRSEIGSQLSTSTTAGQLFTSGGGLADSLMVGIASAGTQMSSGGGSAIGTGGRAGSDSTAEALSAFLMGGAGVLGPGSGNLSSEVGPGGMLRGLSSNSQDTSAPPPPAPPPALTAAAAASSSASPGNQLAGRDPGTSGTSATAIESIEWEAGTLLMGQEETDEKSLRMVMKNSMDIHRLMRSRQKDQLQLHPQQRQQQQQRRQQQQQQQQQQQSSKAEGDSPGGSAESGSRRIGTGSGTVTGGSGTCSSSLLPPSPSKSPGSMRKKKALPVVSVAAAAAAAVVPMGQRQLMVPGVMDAVGSAILNAPSPSTSGAASFRALPPSPSPLPSSGRTGASSASATILMSNTRGAGVRSTPVTVRNMAATAAATAAGPDMSSTTPFDLNWDDDMPDEELFSFLMDPEET